MKRSRRFSVAASSVPGARQFVATSLAALDPEVSQTAALLVSELATNAVVHAASAFAVTVVYPTREGRVRVEVVDRVRGEPTPLRPAPSEPHGRGLLLVSTLAQTWGVKGNGRRAGRRAGKTIWFELAPAGAGAGAGARSEATRGRAGLLRRRRGDSSLFALRPL